jgi:hypothetical protein
MAGGSAAEEVVAAAMEVMVVPAAMEVMVVPAEDQRVLR